MINQQAVNRLPSFEHHWCCKSWFKTSSYCIGFHDGQNHNELMIKNSKMYVHFVAPPRSHNRALKLTHFEWHSVNDGKNKWHDNTTECTLRYIILFHLALGDLGSDFWTVRVIQSKKKTCANLSVYSFMFNVSQRRCKHNSILSLKIGSFSVLITPQIGANTSVSPRERRLCIIGW